MQTAQWAAMHAHRIKQQEGVEIVNEVTIERSAAAVLQTMSDPLTFIRLNPSVRKVTRDAADDTRFQVANEIHGGTAPVQVSVKVRYAMVDGALETESWSPAGVHVRTRWELIERGRHTTVRERTRVRAPAVFLSWAASVSQQVHQEMLLALKAHVESTRRP